MARFLFYDEATGLFHEYKHMSRIVFYDGEAFRELLVPIFTITSCRRFIEREFPRYGAVTQMVHQTLGKIALVQVKTTTMTVLFFGVAVEFVQDRISSPPS